MRLKLTYCAQRVGVGQYVSVLMIAHFNKSDLPPPVCSSTAIAEGDRRPGTTRAQEYSGVTSVTVTRSGGVGVASAFVIAETLHRCCHSFSAIVPRVFSLPNDRVSVQGRTSSDLRLTVSCHSGDMPAELPPTPLGLNHGIDPPLIFQADDRRIAGICDEGKPRPTDCYVNIGARLQSQCSEIFHAKR